MLEGHLRARLAQQSPARPSGGKLTRVLAESITRLSILCQTSDLLHYSQKARLL